MLTMVPHFQKISEYTQNQQDQFIDILETLGYLKCTYLSVVLENKENRMHFFSDSAWFLTFIKEDFMSHCQLNNLSRQKELIISWDCVSSPDKQAQRVMEARSDHNIAHGVTISKKMSIGNLMIAFGADNKNKNFVSALVDNKNFLRKTINQLYQTII